jgi:hypothetical protein
MEALLRTCQVACCSTGISQVAPGKSSKLIRPACLCGLVILDGLRHSDSELGKLDCLSCIFSRNSFTLLGQMLGEPPTRETASRMDQA